MKTAFEKAIGNPEIFLRNMVPLTEQFLKLSGQKELDFEALREFVVSRKDELTKDDHEFQCTAAAFACIMTDFYAQKIRVSGLFRRRLVVESRHYQGDFLDLFYRCMYEGLDLAPKGEGLPS